MSIKLSISAINTYLQCPKKYQIQYEYKIYPEEKSSALLFGSAIDKALNDVLENHGKSDEEIIKVGISTFHKEWEQQQDRTVGTIDLPFNTNIKYSKYDFDSDLLTEEDNGTIQKELVEYNRDLKSEVNSAEEVIEYVEGLMKWQDNIKESHKRMYNFINWVCLRRKGEHIIKAYVKDLLPAIEKVIEVQTELSIEDNKKNRLVGVSDFIAILKPGKYGNTELLQSETVIPDNKTSSTAYDENSVESSPQLSTYRYILNATKGYNIKKGAYFVVQKKFKKVKTKICKSCGNVAEGSHKTCNATVNNKRCGGEWDVKVSIEVPTQIVLQDISDEFTDMVMENADSVIKAVEAEIFPRNLNSCDSQFGSKCPYINYCHKKCMTGLINTKKET